jgi:hypothetical protein
LRSGPSSYSKGNVMKTLGYAVVALLTLTITSLSGAQMFYNNTGPTTIPAAAASTDELADDTPFTGTQHVASFTFQYLNQTSGAVNAVVRFYTVDQNNGRPGSLVATVPVNNLASGMHQIVTVNLDPSQQFDWTAVPGIYGLQSVSGGFVSIQFNAPQSGWYEASGPSLDGFYDLTTGQFITFQGDTSASFYLQVSGAAQASTLSSVDLNPATVKGGLSSNATITLTGPAPAGGLVVSLHSSKPLKARVPASVTIPEGATSATVVVNTKLVKKTTKVTISASLNGALKVATLTLTP